MIGTLFIGILFAIQVSMTFSKSTSIGIFCTIGTGIVFLISLVMLTK